MAKILVIIPYEEIRGEFEKVVSRYREDGIEFTLTCLYGTDPRKLFIVRNYDIVVVRGMTEKAVHSFYPDTFTVSIEINASDLLEALCEVKRKHWDGRKIGILLPDASICSEDTLATLTSLDVTIREVSDESEMVERMNDLRNLGCTVFVGGMTMKRFCEGEKLDYVGIGTGSGTIENSISEAAKSAKIMERERVRARLLQTVSDNMDDPIVVADKNRVVIAFNLKATDLFGKGLERGALMPGGIPADIASLVGTKFEPVEAVSEIAGQRYIASMKPINTGGGGKLWLMSFTAINDDGKVEKGIIKSVTEPQSGPKTTFADIIAEQLSMRQVVAKALRFSSSNAPLLIFGETGTGRKLFAEAVHNSGPRNGFPFLSASVQAHTEDELRETIFGSGDEEGLLEKASGGTLLLYGVDRLSESLQARLTWYLQTGIVKRSGGGEGIKVDTRLISATSCSQEELLSDNSFSKDFYYGISVLSLTIPPLRDRKGDIMPLFKHFLSYYAKRDGLSMPSVDADAEEFLVSLPWRGNILELRNVSERIMATGSGKHITLSSVVPLVDSSFGSDDSPSLLDGEERLYEEYRKSGLTLSSFSQKKGLSRTTLWRRFKELKRS